MNTIKSCLLIDDDQDDQEIFMIALKKSGKAVELVTADNGFLGLERLDSASSIPDYIFLDLNMPGMNGKQCLGEIKRRPALKSVPVIIYSTSFRPEDIRETKELGAFDFITKPASVKELTHILAEFFDKHA